MATQTKLDDDTRTAEDDLGGAYARGEIDLTELNFRAAVAGREATVGEGGLPKDDPVRVALAEAHDARSR